MDARTREDRTVRWVFFEVSESECSVIVQGDARYFLLLAPGYPKAYVSDICPHRGGPLHMGSPDSNCAKIRCPWHKYSWSAKALGARVAPAIRRGKCWSVALPEAGGTPYKLNRKIVLQQPYEEPHMKA